MVASRSAKVLILSSGQALTTLVGIASAAVLARLFSQHDYASYRQTLLAYTFAVPFVTLGFDRALYFFLPNEENHSRRILVENLLCLLAGGVLLSLFLLFGGNRLLATRFNNPELISLLLLLVPYPLLLPATSVPACLMARNRTEHLAGFNVGSRLLMFLVIVVPCLTWPHPSTAIIGTVLGATVTTTAALTLMFRVCNTGNLRPTWSGIRQQFLFSVPLGLASLIGTVSQSLDQLMVAAFCPTDAFAVYVNGAMEIPLIGMITGSVTSVVMVDYACYYRQGRTAEIVALIHRAMEKCAMVLLPAMIFLFCLAPELMRLMFGKPYEASSIPFRIYLLMLPIRTLTFGAVLQATGHSRNVLIQSILGLFVGACFDYVGIRLFGPVGAAIGSVVTIYLVSVPYLSSVLGSALKTSTSRLFPWLTLGKIFLASLLPGLVTAGLLSLFVLPDVIRLLIAAAVYGSGVFMGFTIIGELKLRGLLADLRKYCRF